MPRPSSEPPAEAVHLRHLIEKQPFCLMRVGRDGRLLAANDAALRLLGAEELGQALDTALTARIVPEHHDQWHEFVARVWSGAPNSIECDVTDASGIHRAILFHGVPLIDHPDGIPSMIVGAQDASPLRRLEAALQEGETCRQQLIAEQEAERVQLQQTVGKRQEPQRLLREGRNHLDDLRAQLEQAVVERHRLEILLEEREASHQQLVAQHAAQRSQVEQALEAAASRQKESNKALDDRRVELESLEENALQLAPLAAAGRVALEVGHELLEVLTAIDARAACLLAQCPVEAAERKEIEAIRAEAIRVKLLARQIVQAHPEASARTVPPKRPGRQRQSV